MNKQKSKEIISILREIIPNPVCELDYTDAFSLLVAVMLSAQTTDKRVNTVTPILFSKYRTPFDLANASYSDVKEIIGSLGLANNKATNLIKLANVIHYQYNDIVPSDFNELVKLPGVGRKTANVLLAVYFKIPSMPVDTHLHRMAIRLGYIKNDDDVLKAEESFKKYIPKEEWIDSHHLLLLFGRYYCKAINPRCSDCKLKEYCKHYK